MSFVKKIWQPGRAGGTPVNSADLNRMEQGVADAHDTGVPIIKSLAALPVDFTGLAENVAYELIVRGTMNVVTVGQQVQFFLLPQLLTSGGRNAGYKTYRTNADGIGADSAYPSGSDYGAILAWNDAGLNYNSVLSRTLLCFNSVQGIVTTVTDFTITPTAAGSALYRNMMGASLKYPGNMTSFRLQFGANAGNWTDNAAAVLRKVG